MNATPEPGQEKNVIESIAANGKRLTEGAMNLGKGFGMRCWRFWLDYVSGSA